MAALASPAQGKSPNLLIRLLARPTAAAGLIVITLVVLAAIFAPLLTPHSPSQLSIVNRLTAPNSQFWLGTDELGRDILTRVLYAGQTSLSVAFSVVIVSSLIGIVLGLVAGFFRKADAPRRW